ncbi:MAG: hypothetical protein KA184_05690 [Candidatus Hydrogenedentes bacterium]|nr:hypothetical protein [Candidatus Hydrogenedentota bacterium]
MSKKEKVTLVRSDDFEKVDQELTDAMALLDSANDRVNALLQAAPESERSAAAQAPSADGAAEDAGRAPEGQG